MDILLILGGFLLGVGVLLAGVAALYFVVSRKAQDE